MEDIAADDHVARRSFGVKLERTVPGPGDGVAFEKNIGRISDASHIAARVVLNDAVSDLNMLTVSDEKRHPAPGVFHQYIVNADMLGTLDQKPTSVGRFRFDVKTFYVNVLHFGYLHSVLQAGLTDQAGRASLQRFKDDRRLGRTAAGPVLAPHGTHRAER